ncbi:MAG: hypothetical protein G8345_05960 [Magnetococcales bacterium]|nr:hypothetical protein [Magnetococcales bacterium]NGZ26414.1 hypothetical protein [Magnetococcales bacterium]
MAPPDGVNLSATMDDDFVLSEEDMDYGRSRQKGKKGSDGGTSAKSAQPGYLPPKASGEVSKIWLEVKRNWLVMSATALFSMVVVGGLIYYDYQTTRSYQLASVEHDHCVRSLKRIYVDAGILKRMGIQSPHPQELDPLLENLNVCQSWYREMDQMRPSGGWSRDFVLDFMRKKQPNSNNQAGTQSQNPNPSQS